jgi:hypothetical protein
VGAAPSITTGVVDDATNNAPWSATETVGASADDTAMVAGTGGVTPGGNVTYSLFAGGLCAGAALSSDVETLSAGGAPNSTATAALAAGHYSFQVVYSGDANDAPSASSCEPFTVGQGSAGLSGSVEDASANDALWHAGEAYGSLAIATTALSGVTGFEPTGTINYDLYAGSSCTGSPVATDVVTLTNGASPDSSPAGGLAGGTYSYQAAYSGDANYIPTTGPCEAFAVLPAPSAPTSATPAPPSVTLSLGGVRATAGASGGTGASSGSEAGNTANGALRVMLGEHVEARYSCEDAPDGPGIVSCLGTVADGAQLNTSDLGMHSFTVTSTSADGQTATRTVEYVVFEARHFTLSHLVVHPNPEAPPGAREDQDGIVAFDLGLPGPGGVTVVETAPPHSAVGVATFGTTRRVVYAVAWFTTTRAGLVRLEVMPNAVGRRLIAEHPHHLWLQITTTFRPIAGKSWTHVSYGINASLEPAKAG